jgi:hypothetical protein
MEEVAKALGVAADDPAAIFILAAGVQALTNRIRNWPTTRTTVTCMGPRP